MKVVIYARVSTDEQTVEQQIESLREDCRRYGWDIVAEIADTISGGTFSRKGLDQLMALVRRKKIDLIICHKLDRLGRSLPHLAQMIGEFESHGIGLFIPGQGIDTRTNNPTGRLQMHLLMAFADFERALISERTKLKLQALKNAGVRLGRPKLSSEALKGAVVACRRIQDQTGRSPSCRALARELSVSIGTAHRRLRLIANKKDQETK